MRKIFHRRSGFRSERQERGDRSDRNDRQERGDRLDRSDRLDRNERLEKFRVPDRPKWVPPQIPAQPLPSPECPFCGKPIQDIASALSDKASGKAVHFDCIIAKLNKEEILEKGDFISYIGGGRFGIVRYTSPGDSKKFTIKKILEWENKDERPQWRSSITDIYSVT